MKSKTVTGMCAIFGGTIGLQFLYLGEIGWFLLSMVFLPMLIVNTFIGIMHGITVLAMSDDEFNEKYNKDKK